MCVLWRVAIMISSGFLLTVLAIIWNGLLVGAHSSTMPQVTSSVVCSRAFDEEIVHTPAGQKYYCKFFCYPVLTSQEHERYCVTNCPNYTQCVVQRVYRQCVNSDREIAIGNIVTSCGTACVADPSSEVCKNGCNGLRQCYIDNGWKQVGALSNGQDTNKQDNSKNAGKVSTVNDGCQGAADESFRHPITGLTILCRDYCPPIKSSDQEVHYCSVNCPRYSRCIYNLVEIPCLQFDRRVLNGGYMTPCSVMCVTAPTSQLCLLNCSTLVSCYRSRCLDLVDGNSSAAAAIGGLCNLQSSTSITTEPVHLDISTNVNPQITTTSNGTTNIVAIVVPIVVIFFIAAVAGTLWYKRRKCRERSEIDTNSNEENIQLNQHTTPESTSASSKVEPASNNPVPMQPISCSEESRDHPLETRNYMKLDANQEG